MSSTAARQTIPAEADPLGRFSLTLDGPLYWLYLHSRLLAPPEDLLKRRLIALLTITWLPLLALTVAGGTVLRGVRVPFFADINAHVRLLIALPMLLAAEPLVHWRMVKVVRPFIDRGIVPPAARNDFRAIVETTVRMRNSVLAEVVLLVASTTLSVWVWDGPWFARAGMWFAARDQGGNLPFVAAGWWYTLVSLNLFRFVLLRWYYRLLIWYRFLWLTSRLPLRLNPLHPDRVGGLGFLAGSLFALMPVFLAQSITVAGAIAARVVQDKAPLEPFTAEIVAVPIVLALTATLPLVFFSRSLVSAGFEGALEYGRLATDYVDQFRRRWIPEPADARTRDQLLGTPDLQSLADLGNAYESVRGFQGIPLRIRTFINFVIVLALPFLPLALTVVPIDELLRHVISRLI
jgi:hypothetical protein